ncbi:hypothetical protein LA5095_01478 [Roseibium album]|uniref:Uncharacterized protein n=1 Tax=Roseibium album TaxID=311410 RepID=A0A0M7A538_9HYPH|nr:hypothetical protein LA5094_00412 [Roseibium album]CTQ68734.1 hypothetical protein LA5095_01478 [Roseibium album]CTQ70967.1 hypothetical protein LA5096_02733 [Roseibium album]
MARRAELRGVCRDLLETFTSRNNDLDGYWALGKIQTHLQQGKRRKLCLDLVTRELEKSDKIFFELTEFYGDVLLRISYSRKISEAWIRYAAIDIQSVSNEKILCTSRVKTDLGREYSAETFADVRPHDPIVELRSGGPYGSRTTKRIIRSSLPHLSPRLVH